MKEAPSLRRRRDRKSTRLNSSHMSISYAVFCLKKKTKARTVLFVLNDTFSDTATDLVRPLPLAIMRAHASSGALGLLKAGFDLSPFFFFNDTAPTEIYTLSLHDALPI